MNTNFSVSRNPPKTKTEEQKWEEFYAWQEEYIKEYNITPYKLREVIEFYFNKEEL